MRSFTLIYSLLALVVVTTGCTPSNPTFAVLDQTAIPQPLFDGQTSKAITRGTAGETTLIQGQCDPRVRDIRANVIGQGARAGGLDVVSVGAPSVACPSTGKFNFTLKSFVDLVGPPVINRTYVIELRADTAGGLSNPSVLSLTYTRDTWEAWRLTAGGARGLASGSFRADLRVTQLVGAGDANADANKGTARSPHFIFRRGRAAR